MDRRSGSRRHRVHQCQRQDVRRLHAARHPVAEGDDLLGKEFPQASAGGATARVVFGIGGNDIGFSSMITKCVTAGALYKAAANLTDVSEQAPCERRHHSGDTDTVGQRIETTGQRLDRALDEVKRRAPQARVYVVGYPAILPATASACDGELPLAPGDVTFLREQEGKLNAMLRQRAEAADATYVDTHTPSTGHDACSPPKTRWIEPLEPSSPAARVHPNARGERGMADAVLRAVRS